MMETSPQTSRTRVAVALEQVALLMRYLLYAAIAMLLSAGLIPWSAIDLVIITAVFVLHNAFAHWVLWTKRYEWFATPWNFLVYFIEICVVIYFSGADESDGFVLFILMLIGFSVHTPQLNRVLAASVLFAAAYLALMGIEWYTLKLSVPIGNLVARSLLIVFAGWLVGRMSHLLRRTEREAQSRAQALAVSEETLRAILNSAADPILVFGLDEIVQEANERACAFFGMPRTEIVQQRLRRFFFDDGTVSTRLSAMRARGEYASEQIVLTAEGDERTVDFVVRSFVQDGQRLFVARLRDITEEKDLQEAERQANLRLEELNRELRQVDHLRTGFLASIAHKLRSPLAAIVGHLNALTEEELGEVNDDQRQALQSCQRSAAKMLRTMDESLPSGSGRPETERAPGEKQP